ncbi:uncharacterized protein Nmag_0255 [Natrialba magadii ATCC 43099]|uniref:Uncharacterized protein n=1 Tax=Natrialba magadii (strain ATCC 43099 / DSM 3394 / CCM 3739 / CIP 104546 / IAM 13178 / JCM 8861 / NBRC 102185 / NCIMB 2190 / MS3) TaxID=547559 RepID=D3SX27_NATMM|nr:hypothetical protein [Natrialba magadii]ADD03847.1 uncharacterized protein Nmag_0255 [Natrialba magadii ATCC 43099]ELY33506.1 hypothetical protein C500_01700 [Natrialba magadii ATCC 43099]
MAQTTNADNVQTETIPTLYDALDDVIENEEWVYKGEPMVTVSDEEYDALLDALDAAQADTGDEWAADECLYRDETWSIVNSDADDVWGRYTDGNLDEEVVDLLQYAHNKAARDISDGTQIDSTVDVFVYRR